MNCNIVHDNNIKHIIPANINTFTSKYLVKVRQAQQIFFDNVHKIIMNILFISFLKIFGIEKNPVKSSISDQCYFMPNIIKMH